MTATGLSEVLRTVHSMTNPTTRYRHIEPEHQGKVLNVKQAGPGEVEHHGGSFRKYMDNKNQKLQEQFDQQSAVAAAYGAASGHAVSELFKGVSIMVNGFTTPSQQVSICRVQAYLSCQSLTPLLLPTLVSLRYCSGSQADHGAAWR